MTTVPGHNIVIQQSGAAQEFSHQTHTPKPSPEQALAQQAVIDQVNSTTVLQSDASERLKKKKEKDALRRKQLLARRKQQNQQDEKPKDPDATGRILDITA